MELSEREVSLIRVPDFSYEQQYDPNGSRVANNILISDVVASVARE
jgi:hypothetical protein